MAVTGEERPKSSAGGDDGTGGTGDAGGAPHREEDLRKALTAAIDELREIRAQFERLVGVQLDRIRLKLERGAARLTGALVAGAVGVAVAVAGVLYVLSGVAGGLSELFGGIAWAGKLATGVLALASIAVGAAVVARRRRKRTMERLADKYGRDDPRSRR